jgi:hypothetical protein
LSSGSKEVYVFLPKQILALKRIVAKAAGRYAYSNVRIERTDGGPRAMATDGRRAVVFNWDEPQADKFPPVEGMSSAPAKRFAAYVPPKTLAEAGRGIARRVPNPVLGHLLLDESDASLVRVAARDSEKITRAQARADDAAFPDCVSALPAPGRERTLYDPSRHGAAAFTHTRIGVNAKQFAETLKVVSDLAAEDASNTVVMTVPIDPHRPVRLDARCTGRRAAAAIMPVTTDFSAYDEPTEARRPAPLPAPVPKSRRSKRLPPESDPATAAATVQPGRRRVQSTSQTPCSPKPHGDKTP